MPEPPPETTASGRPAPVNGAFLGLARFKWPTIVEVVDELPHSATGKVAKARLREASG